MRIQFVRSGGLAAAMRREYAADTATLPPDEADELARLVSDADLAGAAASSPRSAGARDTFQYRVTIDHGGSPHIVTLDESAVPESARPLIDWLDRRASPPGRS